MKPVHVLGVRVDPLTKAELIQYIDEAVRAKAHVVVANVNVQAINLAEDQPWFREFLNGSGAVFCDGFGVMAGARILGRTVPERMTPADWIWELAERAEIHGWRVFLLGAKPGVAESAAGRLRSRYPGLKIVGTEHGYFEKVKDHPDNRRVVAAVNAAEPDILVVAFGMPLQELWLQENWADLKVHVALPAGALLDYVSRRIRRGPRWMTQHGLEWLARLVIEPRRLWRRYLMGNPRFLWAVLKERVRRETQQTGNGSQRKGG